MRVNIFHIATARSSSARDPDTHLHVTPDRRLADLELSVIGEHLPCLPRIWSTVRLP
jgi:hypothetical protein